ncbi:hypothetical protein [Tolypothrix sp. VBCCA 56010]|uniref:hypothetical protein n=1 Tax=Tolypothrix sp. VBCCA 56010 TaxID=3137731 RepID=UPI003D7D33E3
MGNGEWGMGTRGQGDKETRRQGGREGEFVSPSPHSHASRTPGATTGGTPRQSPQVGKPAQAKAAPQRTGSSTEGTSAQRWLPNPTSWGRMCPPSPTPPLPPLSPLPFGFASPPS